MIDGKGVEFRKNKFWFPLMRIDEKPTLLIRKIQVLITQMNAQKQILLVLQEQLSTAIRERNRVSNLVKSDAATKNNR